MRPEHARALAAKAAEEARAASELSAAQRQAALDAAKEEIVRAAVRDVASDAVKAQMRELRQMAKEEAVMGRDTCRALAIKRVLAAYWRSLLRAYDPLEEWTA